MAIDRFPIEAGHIMQFARAVADPNPIYDPLQTDASEMLAPPTFTQAGDHYNPDFPLRLRPGQPWFGSGREPMGGKPPGSEGGGVGLYAEHRFVYHRHLRPGDVLSSRQRDGASWEKEGRRGGKLRFREIVTELYDAAGELVSESIIVGVTTEKVVGEQAEP
jgi:hypothetical protein